MENNVLMGELRDFSRRMRGEIGSCDAENDQGEHMDIRVDNDLIDRLTVGRDYFAAYDAVETIQVADRTIGTAIEEIEDDAYINAGSISFVDNGQWIIDYGNNRTYTFDGWANAASNAAAVAYDYDRPVCIGVSWNGTGAYITDGIEFKNGSTLKVKYSQEKINPDFDDGSEELDNFLSSFKLL